MSAAPLFVPSGWITWASVLLVLMIALNGLFVAAETAIDVLAPMHLKHLTETGDRHVARFQAMVDQRSMYVGACTFASHAARVAMVLLGLVVAAEIAEKIDPAVAFWTLLWCAVGVSIAVMLVNLIFAEIVPKSYAALHPIRASRMLYPLVKCAYFTFYLPAAFVSSSAGVVARRFGGSGAFSIANRAEQEILALAATGQESGEIPSDEKELLHSVFEFGDTVAREVMTPRVDLDAMPVTSEPEDVAKMIRETGHSRIPLYEENDDQIVGIVHARDLLLAMVENGGKVEVRKLMRAPLFVPENKKLHDLLTEMRLLRSQMAVVQDEFGGTAGIVTIEDIVEELVGEIVDESDVQEPEIVRVGDGFVVDGKTHVDDVNREIGSEIESEEFDTIGGYVFGLFGRQPRQGETIDEGSLRFTVADTDGRRIMKLKVEPLPDEPVTSGSESGA